MNLIGLTRHAAWNSALVALITVLCGLALWRMPVGEAWQYLSYDYLFRFAARAPSNNVVLLLMDNESRANLRQFEERWDRAVHADLLNRLAADRCPLVVMDVFFRKPGESEIDHALAAAMTRLPQVVLMAEQKEIAHHGLVSAGPLLPSEPFLSAAKTNWGVAFLDPILDVIIRRHWPFPAPEFYPSLPWKAAELAGAELHAVPREQWLRYYAPGTVTRLSYHLATNQPANYFSNKFVFIGSKPKTSVPGDGEKDEFRSPHTRWTGRSSGGVEILATEFLNLLRNEWLRRPPPWIEIIVLLMTGALLGWVLWHFRRPGVCWIISFAAAMLALIAGVMLSYFTNFWFPWLIISAGQVPCALACVWIFRVRARRKPATIVLREAALRQEKLATPDYEVIDPPFGGGAYGKVWLARNAVGQWQALKAVYRANFGEDEEPYEREFRGIKRYKPVSDKHPGLLRIDFVSRMKPEGYFYYVMELGDAEKPGWKENPATYKPCDLARVRANAPKGRLPVRECVRIGVALSDALHFLHSEDVTHRDIKPQNIIFVQGNPKLADVGLAADAKPPSGENTRVGTPGYMPPEPEPLGTPQADIYGLGMVLYVISTGRTPTKFPELSATLMDKTGHEDFTRLNQIIVTACQPDIAQRYPSAAAMRDALAELARTLATREQVRE